MKVNDLDSKISAAVTLINTIQCNIDKQSSEKKMGDVDKKYLMLVI